MRHRDMPKRPVAIAALRKDYSLRALRETDLAPDPFTQFGVWFEEAMKTVESDPNAMTLATASPEGQPSARVVLLKGFDAEGFVFFTNYRSRKSRELSANGCASLVFYWSEVERQVCICGTVAKVAPSVSDTYFASRPRGSQLGAWVSAQSDVAPSREALEERLEECAARFADGLIPRPGEWGGFCVRPETVEFWQGRPSRLHDRFRYTRAGERWNIERLWP